MHTTHSSLGRVDRAHLPSQKETAALQCPATSMPDSLRAWMDRYLLFAITEVRLPAISQKITLHLARFHAFFVARYGHDHITICVQHDVLAWQTHLRTVVVDSPTGRTMAASTVNNHLASLSSFTSWVHAHAPRLFAVGDPAKGIGEVALPPLEPRSLTTAQVQSLKNLCDRLPRLHQLRGRRWADRAGEVPLHAHGRPLRDRAIVFVLLSTGLRREELVRLNCDQVLPPTLPE